MKYFILLLILFGLSLSEETESAGSDIKDKTWSIGCGSVTNKTFNLIQFTKDFKISDNWSFFLSSGFPSVFGLGITGQSDYNNNGLIFSWAAAGAWSAEEVGYGLTIESISLAYQWRILKSSNFISFGLNSRSLTDAYGEDYTWTSPSPVFSFDYRF
tara:strand:- start:111 stop:581 length:471 start_codon:yes stop_codon:yes gene_type:complete